MDRTGTQGIDYRDLLTKYIAHVEIEESITFLEGHKFGASHGLFSAQEWDELKALEVDAESIVRKHYQATDKE